MPGDIASLAVCLQEAAPGWNRRLPGAPPMGASRLTSLPTSAMEQSLIPTKYCLMALIYNCKGIVTQAKFIIKGEESHLGRSLLWQPLPGQPCIG